MPSMMAIISKKLFESEQGRLEGRLARLGDLLPLESYLSSNKRLEALSGGGALFLVTVRPSERLWLVAVLEKPRYHL